MLFRRSIYAVKDILEGEDFTHENIKFIRPGYGAEPRNYHKFLGTKATRTFQKRQQIE